jgi:hypothetical protein
MDKKDSLKSSFVSADLSSRGKRRKVVTLIIGLLERLRAEEQMFIVRMPLNLQGSDAYDAAEYSIDILDETIDVISSVYD